MTDTLIAGKWTTKWQQYIHDKMNVIENRLKALVVLDETTMDLVRHFSFNAAKWSRWDDTNEPNKFTISISYKGNQYLINGDVAQDNVLSMSVTGIWIQISNEEKEFFIELLEDFPVTDMLLEFQPNKEKRRIKK